jgi:hypothetical protein
LPFLGHFPQLFQKFGRGGINRGKSGLGLYFCRISASPWSSGVARSAVNSALKAARGFGSG